MKELVNVSAQITKELRKQIRQAALDLDICSSEFIRQAIKEKIEKMKQETGNNV